MSSARARPRSMRARFVSTGHSRPDRKVGSSACSPALPRTIVSGKARSWRNGKRAAANRSSHLPDGSSAPPRTGVASHRRQDVGAQRLELAHGSVLRLGRAHLEGRVPRDRHPHQPPDHLGEVAGLAALLPLLGRAHLVEQSAHRRDRAERLEPTAEPGEILARDCGRPGGRTGSRRSRRPPGCRRRGPSGKLRTQPPSVPITSPTRSGKDERADRRRREDGAAELVGIGRAARVDAARTPGARRSRRPRRP